MKKIDLHIHTNLSDGDLSVNEIINLSNKNNCKLISITDHDHIIDSNLCKNDYGITIIPGVELNSTTTGMHILGYGMIEDSKLKNKLQLLNEENEQVCLEVIKILQKNGFEISKEEIKEYYQKNSLPFNILDKKKIVKYLIYKEYTKSILETYDTLIGKNAKYYVPIKKMSPKQCIETIKESGGISVLAHPETLNLNNDDLYKQIKELSLLGLDGIEIINQKIKNNNTSYYQKLANEFNLIETVGSDFHSLAKQTPGIYAEEKLIDNFYNKMVKTKKIGNFK